MRTMLRRHLALLSAVLLIAGCGSNDGGGATREATPSKEAAAPTGEVALALVGSFASPVQVLDLAQNEQMLVVEQGGRIRLVTGMRCTATCPAEPVSSGRVVLDLSEDVSSGNEQGLLGAALHPDWPRDPRIFINYTDQSGDTRIEQWRYKPGDAAARGQHQLVRIQQPYANHNGGHLEFGPDGLLYIASGDGGNGGDPHDHAQDPTSLLGKLLRIDVDDPADVDIWAIGLRNPWRFTFDADTGDMWIADVGQNAFEEINVLPAARVSDGEQPNFGWRLREGFSQFDDSGRTGPGALIEPVIDYGRDDGCSITGGVVYRGTAVPQLAGAYLFADFCDDDLRILDRDAEQVASGRFERGELTWRTAAGAAQVTSFAQLEDGEVLVASRDGDILQVVTV